MSLRIAIVGAEGTGKTTLARDLGERLQQATGLRTQVVSEFLREWCDREGRTPHADEQRAIAEEQGRRIEAASLAAELIVADTTPLMAAVYSDLRFADRSLYPFALEQQLRYDLTLFTALDLPWIADGLDRAGLQLRKPVDRALRGALLTAGIGWSLVSGSGEMRVEAALNAVTPLLTNRKTPRNGLFVRLAQRDGAQPQWRWVCEKCDVPECEHLTGP
ncbi:MAG TPA: ATP-binding protein [Burkholderiaceae bacterium]|nr:ATP-binding protein [Burkholderiaceae bacterium]